MRIKPTELELRQAVLAGTTLLLILVHMVAPGAGVDAVSVILLVFLALVLYGDEITLWLARMQEQRVVEPKGESELPGRVREIGFRAEHARVAATTESIAGSPVSDTLEAIIERARAEPRAVLLLLWGTLEDRLRAATGAADGLQGAKQLAERGKLPRQFVEAYDAFRSLRNDIARAGNGDVTDDVLWSVIDVGGALLALAPSRTSDRGTG